MGDCIESLESSPDAFESDKLLCQWVRVQHIAEDVGVRLSMDDPCASITLSDKQVRCALKEFEKQLEDWYAQLPKELLNCKIPYDVNPLS